MSDTDINQQFSFTLKRIHLIEKSLGVMPSGLPKSEEFDFDISLQIATNPENRESIHVMQVSINTKKLKQKVGSIRLACAFFIPNFDDYKQGEQNIASLPQGLIYLLNAVVIGTMRGVMFSEFRGTVLNSVFLPVLDPRQFEQQGAK